MVTGWLAGWLGCTAKFRQPRLLSSAITQLSYALQFNLQPHHNTIATQLQNITRSTKILL